MGTENPAAVIRDCLKESKGFKLLRVSFFGERGEEAPKELVEVL